MFSRKRDLPFVSFGITMLKSLSMISSRRNLTKIKIYWHSEVLFSFLYFTLKVTLNDNARTIAPIVFVEFLMIRLSAETQQLILSNNNSIQRRDRIIIVYKNWNSSAFEVFCTSVKSVVVTFVLSLIYSPNQRSHHRWFINSSGSFWTFG